MGPLIGLLIGLLLGLLFGLLIGSRSDRACAPDVSSDCTLPGLQLSPEPRPPRGR